MRDMIRNFFSKISAADAQTPKQDTTHNLHVATCALFLEMARIDESFTPEELETLIQILKQKYSLSNDHADALIAESDPELKKSVDLWKFARIINENYSNQEKIEIIETLWRIVFVDGKMDKYEN